MTPAWAEQTTTGRRVEAAANEGDDRVDALAVAERRASELHDQHDRVSLGTPPDERHRRTRASRASLGRMDGQAAVACRPRDSRISTNVAPRPRFVPAQEPPCDPPREVRPTTCRVPASDLIYDWNLPSDAVLVRVPARPGRRRDAARRPAEPLGPPPRRRGDGARSSTAWRTSASSALNIGLPGAGPHVVASAERLAREIRDQKLRHPAATAPRARWSQDIEPIRRISRGGRAFAIEVAMFIGSSPIRMEVEAWDRRPPAAGRPRGAFEYCVGTSCPIMFVTEDTTRTPPEVVRALYGQALDMGAARLVVCDTCGHATAAGVARLVRLRAQEVAADHGEPDVQIDWHGHQDRGLGVINAIAAYEAGAHRLHATALGRRRARGQLPHGPAARQPRAARLPGRGPGPDGAAGLRPRRRRGTSGVQVPLNYPVVGNDAFETGTGVHAAAVIKALRRGERGSGQPRLLGRARRRVRARAEDPRSAR